MQSETELRRTQRIAKDRSARREPSKSGSDRLKLNPHTTFVVEVEGDGHPSRYEPRPTELNCLPKILKPILDHSTDFLETFHVIYTLVG